MKLLTKEEAKNYAHKITVRLNGTDKNPFHRFGLTQNPLPQTGRDEWVQAELIVNKLGGDPIPDTDYIRKVLEGFDPEFVELCCKKFKKGETVVFDVHFNN